MFKHLFAPAIGRISWYTLVILLIGVYRIHAQEWTFQAGTNVTTFSFQTSNGIPLSGIKPGSGQSVGFQYHRKWVDTSALLLKSSPTAIYMNQHPWLAKLLSRFQWGLGIQMNQLNAVGDAVNTVYSYQTNYVGITPSLQLTQVLYKGLSFQASGEIQINRMLQGNQLVNNRFVDLMQEEQFNGIQTMLGYRAGIRQKITEYIQISLSLGKLASTGPSRSQGTSLHMQPTSILFSIILTSTSK